MFGLEIAVLVPGYFYVINFSGKGSWAYMKHQGASRTSEFSKHVTTEALRLMTVEAGYSCSRH